MLADQQVLIRFTAEDKKMLQAVSKHFQRSQSDAIRVLVRRVYEVIEKEKTDAHKSNQRAA
jgi:hypothetical protein